MCGIFAVFGDKDCLEKRQKYYEASKTLRHRGPDWNGIYIDDKNGAVVCHERLSIIDVEHGAQPIYDGQDKNYVLSVNGEIYNHKLLKENFLESNYEFQSNSDCEVILHLYKEFGNSLVNMLDGIFCFVLYDRHRNNFLVARDPIGVNPLYMATVGDSIAFASEMKALLSWNPDAEISLFPPGHCMESDRNLIRYYNPTWINDTIPDRYLNYSERESCDIVRNSLIESVDKRLMSDVPFGVLLSGGLDSSLVSSIAVDLINKRGGTQFGNKVHSFSIGLKGAPDLKYAKIVAEHLDTIHHEINFTVEEGIDAIRDVIYHLETYDTTTIRASTPMFLISRKIKAMGIKMVLSGEGADEIHGGYLYFHNAPSDDIFHKECCKRVKNLHYFDCLRANKSTMAWGLEVRVPFLDKKFIRNTITITPKQKMGIDNDKGINKIEKYIVRRAFDEDVCGKKYLPDEILWRQKEQFSDGVGYNWVDSLKEKCETIISDEEFSKATELYPHNTPKTKEQFHYRNIFDTLFPKCEKSVQYWVPNTDWQGVKSDPSGRAQQIHDKCDEKL